MPVNSVNDLWSKISEECKKNVTELAYNTFFKYLTPDHIDQNEFVLITQNDYLRDTLTSLYGNIIKDAIKAVTGLDIAPRIVVSDKEDEEIKRAEDTSEGLTFEDFFTFDNFIVGTSNKFAYAACMAVAQKDSIVYNPLIIYGPSGVGKTHLLLAIKNYLKKNYPYKRVEYTRGEEFTNQYIDALQKVKLGMNTLEDFRAKYRKTDVFLIDDIHFIAGKEGSQEEFFNTFNALYQSNKQIIVTLDRPLKEIKTLDDRIRSRLSAGLFADVTPPDYETRVGIINKKAEHLGIKINENLVYYIAEQIKKNTRQLEGVVKKLAAYISLEGKAPSHSIVQEYIKEIQEENRNMPTVEKIISEVARTYNVSENDILSNRRSANLVLARQVAMYISRQTTDLSFEEIGESFGKDHTTVLYSNRRIEEFLKDKPYEKELVDDIIKNLKGEEEY